MKTLKKGSLPPMITPFTENGDVDYSAFEYNIAKWNKTNLIGYVVLGSNSETAFLNEEEKDELIRITAATASKGCFLMVGTGMEGLRETIRYTNKAARMGMDAALVLTPSYYSSDMNSENLIRYFNTLADASDLPIFIYNVTKFTHVNIKADAVAELSRHPNIIGMKDSLGDIAQIGNFMNHADPSYNIMAGTASVWYPALHMGVTNGVMALANCCPNECCEIQGLFEVGKWAEARALYLRMLPVNTAVTSTYGVGGLKYACSLLGYRGGHVRLPLLDMKEESKVEIRKILEKAKLL